MGGPKVVANMVKGLIEELNINIPVALHLDHGKSFEMCKKVIDAGYTSVMIDGSKLPLEENISLTKEVIEYAEPRGVTVEGEVGGIGGEEDEANDGIRFAKIEDCIQYVNETHVDFLAPALGSVHGLYKGEPDIQFETMKQVGEATGLPLVLHGATGIPDEDIKEAISCGTAKININTKLQMVWNEAVRKFIKENEAYDPRKVIGSGEKAIKEAAKETIILFQNR